jgi:hypothetical protein
MPSHPILPMSGHFSLHNYALIHIFRQPEMISSSTSFPEPRHAERRLGAGVWPGLPARRASLCACWSSRQATFDPASWGRHRCRRRTERAQAGWHNGGGRRSMQDFAGQRFDDAGHLAGCFEVGSVVAADQDRRLGVRYYGGKGLKAFAEVRRAALGSE